MYRFILSLYVEFKSVTLQGGGQQKFILTSIVLTPHWQRIIALV